MSAPALFLGATSLKASQVALTAADELAYEALDEQVKQLVRRIAQGGGLAVLLGQRTAPDDALSAAYRQGWEDAIEEVSNVVPDRPSDSDIRWGMQKLAARGFC